MLVRAAIRTRRGRFISRQFGFPGGLFPAAPGAYSLL